MLSIILFLALFQSLPERTVPLIFNDGRVVVIVKESEAARLQREPEAITEIVTDRSLFPALSREQVKAAAELALMVQPHNCPFTPRDATEIERCRTQIDP